jgi:hypothetical protein
MKTGAAQLVRHPLPRRSLISRAVDPSGSSGFSALKLVGGRRWPKLRDATPAEA